MTCGFCPDLGCKCWGLRCAQDRMHLDCVFSILGDDVCLMLEEMMGEASPTAPPGGRVLAPRARQALRADAAGRGVLGLHARETATTSYLSRARRPAGAAPLQAASPYVGREAISPMPF